MDKAAAASIEKLLLKVIFVFFFIIICTSIFKIFVLCSLFVRKFIYIKYRTHLSRARINTSLKINILLIFRNRYFVFYQKHYNTILFFPTPLNYFFLSIRENCLIIRVISPITSSIPSFVSLQLSLFIESTQHGITKNSVSG